MKTITYKPIIQIEPWIDHTELEQLKRVIDSTYLTEHKLTKEFEDALAHYTKSKYVIAVSNGSMALCAGLLALGIGHGDEVIVPNFTFVASSNAVLLAGAKPVFCEVDPNTFCIDVTRIEALITPRTKAIMPVHLYGQSADVPAVVAIAKKHHLKVIEDAAQAIGVLWEGEHVGLKSDLSIISFYGNKTITCGEGGVVMTQDKAIAEKVYRLKNHGRAKRGMFIHEEIGYNFSITEMQSAIGVAQMHKLPAIILKKQAIFDKYATELAGIRELNPVEIDKRCTPVFWFTSFLTPHRDALEKYLKSFNIQTRKFFCPLHLQPCYQGMFDENAKFPISTRIYEQGISLPSAYHLTETEQNFVIDRIKHFFEQLF
ncbi:MAG: hypothetical protein RIS64_1206 [Bacteroidota bacterium]|jgi:perosamine synthetase